MYLITKSADGREQFFELPSDQFQWLIGRDRSCQVALDSGVVSRSHALLEFSQGAFSLTDCDSKGGVYLNGLRLKEKTPLSVTDRIRIGNFELLLSDSMAYSSGEDDNGTVSTVQSLARTSVEAPAPASVPGNDTAFKYTGLLYTNTVMALKKKIHENVLAEMNMLDIALSDFKKPETLAKLEKALDRALQDFWHELPKSIPFQNFREAVLDDLIYYGPISPLLRMDEIDEIMVNGPDLVFIERKGLLYETGIRFFSNQHLTAIIQRIVEPLGRHIDEASPMVDARLPDGSRVNAVIPPLSLDGASITIRKFARHKLTTGDLVRYGSMTDEMALFLEEAVKMRQNILISGGTGSGKTTLLNVVSQFIPIGERLVTIEDSAELKLSHRNLVRLEARPANIEGRGRIAIRDLVVNALRMRPDRIIVGECRGAEALDMLQAMNTGHNGSLSTIHANSPRDAIDRLGNMVLMAGYELPLGAIHTQICSAINLIVQQTRLVDGSRKITRISEIIGREGSVITMQDIFVFKQEGIDAEGRVTGAFSATGNIPTIVNVMRQRGMSNLDISIFAAAKQGSGATI